MVEVYYVRNWHRFQHYRHRNPPWVKLHNQILNSTDWIGWSDATRLTALCCLIVASMNGGCVPNDTVMIKKLCRMNWRVDLQPLVKSGFLSENASTVLADASRPPLQSRDRDRDRVEKKVSVEVARKRAPQPKGTRLALDWAPSIDDLAFADKVLGTERTTEEAEKFKDYWIARNDNGAIKRDWSRTWRNWIRNSNKGNGNGHGRPRAFQDDRLSVSAALKRQIEQAERGEFTFGPRPGLPPQSGLTDVVLLPKGRSSQS